MPMGWVAAGSAVLGGVESIEGNNAAKGAAKANNAENAITNGALNTGLSDAENIASTPYEAYTGAYAAPLAANEQQGITLASKNALQGEGQGDVEKGVSQIDQVAGSSWNPQTQAEFENPYNDAVTKQAVTAANRQYLQADAAAREKDAQEGAFGGSGTALQRGELAGQNQLNIGDLTARGKAAGYNQAFSDWQASNDTKLKAADAYDKAGGDITKMNGQDVSQLMATGGTARAIAQTNLAGQYGEFTRKQGWSANQLQPLIQMTKGGAAQYSPGVASNNANALMGVGSTLAGLYGSGLGKGGGGSNGGIDTNMDTNGVNATIGGFDAGLPSSDSMLDSAMAAG